MTDEAKETKESKQEDLKEQLLRVRADFDNAKKRMEREKNEAIKYANERMLAEILPIVDNLDRALQSMEQGHPLEKVKVGLKIAQAELHAVLETHGVEVIKCGPGQEFDPNLHEAVAVVDAENLKEGQIVDEVQKGYLLNGRLVRPSRVRVAQQAKKD
jgi:molecular chaperone GrpE